MEIHAERPEPDVLAAWGFQAACLLYAGDWDGLAQRFGYALAWDEAPQAAIRRDTAAGLAELGAGLLRLPDKHAVQVRYFPPLTMPVWWPKSNPAYRPTAPACWC